MKQRLDQRTRSVLRFAVGACPSCAVFSPAWANGRSVLYRRSHRSITMRCEDCGLQWTMTLAKINAAMKGQLANPEALDPDSTHLYEDAAALTEPAAAKETRGRKPATRARRT